MHWFKLVQFKKIVKKWGKKRIRTEKMCIFAALNKLMI